MTRFYPATPQFWATFPYGIYTAIELAIRCRLVLEPADLELLKKIPVGAHLILVSNHADEMDIRVYMELARRAGKRFRFMVNAEAFEEMRGFAGFWMTRVGCFSVERGALDERAMQHAVEAVTEGQEVLVMFPEGEIHYLNDQVQAFKTGAVRLGFEALQKIRKTDPGASVFILPAAIKYYYDQPIAEALKERLRRLEEKIQLRPQTQEIRERLTQLMKHVLVRHQIKNRQLPWSSSWNRFAEDVSAWRDKVLSSLEKKYARIWDRPSQQLMDRAFRLMAGLRERMENAAELSTFNHRELRRDLAALKRTVWFASWSPQYHENNPSSERLAESVIKLEREILGQSRPKPLGRRAVCVRIGTPVNLGECLEAYDRDPKLSCREISDALRGTIQSMILTRAAGEEL